MVRAPHPDAAFVSPAYAGIDLHRRSRSRAWRRLPRVRGDRPSSQGAGVEVVGSPPRTRGSTCPRPPPGLCTPVSPAYAGIDPQKDSSSSAPLCLPRVRGDRPSKAQGGKPLAGSPPRTRGSTLHPSQRWSSRRVSPAYAGIDLFRLWRSGGGSRLPRVRGDRPHSPDLAYPTLESPPRTRGSTQPRFALLRSHPVSPAYAGIDPSPPPNTRSATGLPRVRGDRPKWGFALQLLDVSPPRTRGSTRHTPAGRQRPWVSPAYAGIDLKMRNQDFEIQRLPRVRGDRPLPVVVERVSIVSPPRTRGSTSGSGSRRCRCRVSPAYAGIDPITVACLIAPARLPRVRGDRPLYPRMLDKACASPPRTRGSTPCAQAERGHSVVSPAYAGIDPA